MTRCYCDATVSDRGDILGIASLLASAADQPPALDDEAFFESKVRPVLATNCVECHGATKASGGLRLDCAKHC